MSSELIHNIAKLRVCVAFLGEKDQQNWWSSSFLSRSGEVFLTPVFPKTSQLARLNGTSSAARLAHDELIGVGDVYHLFRLPENVEHDIAQYINSDDIFTSLISSVDDAYTNLLSLAESESAQGVGPLLLDQAELNQNLVCQMAAAYLAGFQSNQAVYPYYRGKA